MKGSIDEERRTGTSRNPWRIWKLLSAGFCAKLCRRTTNNKAKCCRRSCKAKLARAASEQGRDHFCFSACEYEVRCGVLYGERGQTIETAVSAQEDGRLPCSLRWPWRHRPRGPPQPIRRDCQSCGETFSNRTEGTRSTAQPISIFSFEADWPSPDKENIF
jgi:hypothetical protein